ncbi:hypothetical protein J3E72DRAFT_185724 [Bipolaris maydis]|nr:hypothetical protein J3E72DRAFT_185724 [Bipolaris maydis]
MANKHDLPAPPIKSTEGQLLCLTICGYRRPGMSEDDYRRHMTQVSGPMTKELMVKYGIIGWRMLHNTTETRNLMRQLFNEHMINLADFDCFSQVTFKSIDGYKRMREDALYKKQISGDHINFADTQRSMMTIGWVTDVIENGKLVEDSATACRSKKTITIKLQDAAIILGSFLSGSMISLSAMTIPILLETTTDAFQLLCQWTRVYYYGHHVLLGIAIWTFLSYTLVCFRRRKAVTSKLWHLLAVTVLSTVSIILFTLLIMKHTNREIIPYGIHDENDSVGRAQGRQNGIHGLCNSSLFLLSQMLTLSTCFRLYRLYCKSNSKILKIYPTFFAVAIEYYLLIIFAFILTFLYLSLSFCPENRLQMDNLLAEDGEVLAGVESKTWAQLSMFEHVERGLRRNPHGPAVVCLMEQSISIQNLVTACSGTSEGNESNGFQCHSATPKLTSFTLTYTQLHHTALRIATGLLAVGVQPNTTMIMLIPNGAEYAILLWTCILLRITYVNLDPSLLDMSSSAALKQMLQMARPQLVVAPDTCSGKMIDIAISELGLPQPVRICLSDSVLSSTGWKSFVAVAAHANSQRLLEDESLGLAARHHNPNRINSIMFTSGTSGMPKGCPQTVAAMSYALHSQEWLIDPDSGAAKYALMQAHNSRGIAPAQTLQTWRAGGAVVFTGQSFSVPDAIKAIDLVGASFLVLTPPMVHEFAIELAKISLDLSCVRRIQIGGDAVTKEVLIKCAALFPQAQVCVNQGMTEGPGVFTWPFLGTRPETTPFIGGQICPVGVVAPGAKIRLRSIAHEGVVRIGELGELHISCPSIIKSYLGGRSADMFYNDTEGGWFNTRDMAMIDENGLVFIMGRRKDMIQRAGVMIAPAIIESCISTLIRSQVILGAQPIAVVESFTNVSVEQVKQHVCTAIGDEYALGGVVCLKQLGLARFPVNATHKIIKSELQEAVLKYWK